MDIKLITAFLNCLFIMNLSDASSTKVHVLSENNSYSSVSIENSIIVPTVQSPKLEGIKLLWADGKFYAKRGGLIIRLLHKNVEPVLQNLSKEEIESVIKSKKPIRLSRNSDGKYNIEYLLVL